MNLEGWRIMATKASQRNWMVNTNGVYWSILNGLYKQKAISNEHILQRGVNVNGNEEKILQLKLIHTYSYEMKYRF